MSAHAPPGTISTRRAEEQGDVSIAALLMARATATQIADHDRASPVGIGIPPVVGAVRIPAVIGTIRLIGADDHDRRRHLISRDWGRRHHDAMREANQEGHPHRQYDEPSFEALHRQLSTSAMCFGRRARHPARPGPWWHTDSSTSGGYLQHMLCHSERSAFRRREKRPGARITLMVGVSTESWALLRERCRGWVRAHLTMHAAPWRFYRFFQAGGRRTR